MRIIGSELLKPAARGTNQTYVSQYSEHAHTLHNLIGTRHMMNRMNRDILLTVESMQQFGCCSNTSLLKGK